MLFLLLTKNSNNFLVVKIVVDVDGIVVGALFVDGIIFFFMFFLLLRFCFKKNLRLSFWIDYPGEITRHLIGTL